MPEDIRTEFERAGELSAADKFAEAITAFEKL